MLTQVQNFLSPRRMWNAWSFWLKVLIASALVFLVASLGTWWTGDRAAFPSWLEGVATAAALVAAMFAARYAANAYVLEFTAQQDRQRDQVRAQAALVAAWFGAREENWGVAGETQAPMGSSGSYLMDVIYLRNASDVPVTRVHLRLFHANEPCGVLDFGLLPPASVPEYVAVREDLKQYADPELVEIFGAEYCVGIAFQDASSRRWYRAPDGSLVDEWPDWALV